MNFQYLDTLKRNHPTWRLLSADTAPFILSFLEKTFIKDNTRSIGESLLLEKLEDHINYIQSINGEDALPRNPSHYLDDWSENSHGWIRKYYPRRGDEAEYDITPAAEKAIEWIRSFEKKEFVGTESRLLLIFSMLRDLANATESDPQAKINELEKRKSEIEDEIEQIKSGDMGVYDGRQVRENIWRIEEEIRSLMSDFREVEENFRILDRQTRENIATSTRGKSEILDDIFKERDAIEHSEQGKSFSAFWFFLLSQVKQQELDRNTAKVLALKETSGSAVLRSMKYNLLEGGARAKHTLGGLNEQLSIFLDNKLWIENKRIMELIQQVEDKALKIRNNAPSSKNFFSINAISAAIELPMGKKLFSPPQKPPGINGEISLGSADTVPDFLYTQHYVDESKLREHIALLLAERTQVTLQEIGMRFPYEKGLSEIITYMVLASKDGSAVIDDRETQEIEYRDHDIIKKVTLPRVIFSR